MNLVGLVLFVPAALGLRRLLAAVWCREAVVTGVVVAVVSLNLIPLAALCLLAAFAPVAVPLLRDVPPPRDPAPVRPTGAKV